MRRLIRTQLWLLAQSRGLGLLLALLTILNPGPSLFAEGVPSQEASTQNSQLLTFHVYKAILLTYLDEGFDEKWNTDFVNNQYTLRALLADWEGALRAGQISHTADYFRSLQKRSSLLGHHFNVIQRIHCLEPKALQSKSNEAPQKADCLNLGHFRNQVLSETLMSEGQPLQPRLSRLLKNATEYFITRKTDHELGLKIVNAFANYEDPQIQKQAQDYLLSAPQSGALYERLKILRDLSGLAIFRPQALAETIVGAKRASEYLTQVAQKLEPHRQKILQTLMTKIKNLSLIQKSILASVGVHAGVAQLDPQLNTENKNPTLPLPSPPKAILKESLSLSVSLSLLDLSTQPRHALFPKIKLIDHPLATSSNSKTNWIEQGFRILKGEENQGVFEFLAYSEVFLNLISKRPSSDWTPRDFAVLDYNIQEQRSWIKAHILPLPREERLEALRKWAITGSLFNYRADDSLLFGTLLGWGGNCVAQTQTFLAWLMEFPQILPEKTQLGVVLFPDHIEPILIGPHTLQFLVSGKKTTRPVEFSVLKPEILIKEILTQVDAKRVQQIQKNFPSLNKSYFIQPNPIQTAKTTLSLLDKTSGLFKNWSYQKGLSSLLSRDHSINGTSSDSRPPDQAQMTYRDLSQNQDHLGSDRSSPVGLYQSLLAQTKDSFALANSSNQVIRHQIQYKDKVIDLSLSQSYSSPLNKNEGKSIFTSGNKKIDFDFYITNVPNKMNRLTFAFYSQDPETFSRYQNTPPQLWLPRFLIEQQNELYQNNLPQFSKWTRPTINQIESWQFEPRHLNILFEVMPPKASYENQFIKYKEFIDLIYHLENGSSLGTVADMKSLNLKNEYSFCSLSVDWWVFDRKDLSNARRISCAILPFHRVLTQLQRHTLGFPTSQYENLKADFQRPIQDLTLFAKTFEKVFFTLAFEPLKFIERYHQLPYEWRLAFWKDGIILEGLLLTELRTFLTKLNPTEVHTLDVKFASDSQQLCAPFKIQLPTATHKGWPFRPQDEGQIKPCVNNPALAETSTADSNLTTHSPARQKESPPSHQNLGPKEAIKLELPVSTLAEVSVFSSSGFQLWDKKVTTEIQKQMVTWRKAGLVPWVGSRHLHPGFFETADPIKDQIRFVGAVFPLFLGGAWGFRVEEGSKAKVEQKISQKIFINAETLERIWIESLTESPLDSTEKIRATEFKPKWTFRNSNQIVIEEETK